MPTKKDKPKLNLIKASDMPEIQYVPTGIPGLDEVIKGFPRKRITEIYGMESIGKTTVTMMCAAALTQKKHKVLYIDCENSFNPMWARSKGVDLKYMDVLVESAMEVVGDTILEYADKYDVIIVDSVAAMIPMREREGEIGDSNIGVAAKTMNQLMRMSSDKLYKSDCALIFINQLRQNLEMYAAKTVTPGGWALKFFATLRLELKSATKDKIIKAGKEVGHTVHCKVAKSKIGGAGKIVDFNIMKEE